MQPVPSNPDYAARVRDSFDRMAAMRLIGARIGALEPGRCTVEAAAPPDLTQQHGFVHGGILAMLADTAGGYAAFTLMPADATVLTVSSSSTCSRRRAATTSARLPPCSRPGVRSRSCGPTCSPASRTARPWWRRCR